MASKLTVKLTVLCSGVDAAGNSFEERTRTTSIQPRGGTLLSNQKLAPGSAIELCLLARPDRRVKATIGSQLQTLPDGTEYAFQFNSASGEFWGLRFPGETTDGEAGNGGASSPMGDKLVAAADQLSLLAAHADDHLRYVNQEMEVLRQRFQRELQAALDAGARQLRQLARSTMETTFRSLLEDLARRAAETVDENLNRLRAAADESIAQHRKVLADEADAHVADFHEKLEKQARQASSQLQEDMAKLLRELADATTARSPRVVPALGEKSPAPKR